MWMEIPFPNRLSHLKSSDLHATGLYSQSDFKDWLARLYEFKVDRLQIILVAKNIYIYVSQLFISSMPNPNPNPYETDNKQ